MIFSQEDEDAASEDGGTNNTVDVEDAEKASADNARSTSAERISRSPSPAEKYMTAEERQAALVSSTMSASRHWSRDARTPTQPWRTSNLSP